MRYAVTVTFKIRPDQFEAFMVLMLANAQASRLNEEGCHVFDVATDAERPGEVFLYELYDDRAAFEAHLETLHFKAFDNAIKEMVLEKEIKTYAQVVQ